jgi:hypothetical protein
VTGQPESFLGFITPRRPESICGFGCRRSAVAVIGFPVLSRGRRDRRRWGCIRFDNTIHASTFSGDRHANIAINGMCVGNLSKFERRNSNTGTVQLHMSSTATHYSAAQQNPPYSSLRHIDRNKNRAPQGREKRARDDSPCVS